MPIPVQLLFSAAPGSPYRFAAYRNGVRAAVSLRLPHSADALRSGDDGH